MPQQVDRCSQRGDACVSSVYGEWTCGGSRVVGAFRLVGPSGPGQGSMQHQALWQLWAIGLAGDSVQRSFLLQGRAMWLSFQSKAECISVASGRTRRARGGGGGEAGVKTGAVLLAHVSSALRCVVMCLICERDLA